MPPSRLANLKEGTPQYIYYHPVLEAKLVTSNGLSLSVATEFIENLEIKETEPESFEKQKQDCELKAFYRLAPRLKALFPQLKICLLLDGLYAAKPVFDICEKFGWKYIVTFKEGSMPAVYQEFEALKRLAPENSAWVGKARVTQNFQWVTDVDLERYKINILECEEKTGNKNTHFAWLTNFRINLEISLRRFVKHLHRKFFVVVPTFLIAAFKSGLVLTPTKRAAEEDIFNLTNDLSIEIGSIVKKEVDVIPIYKDFRKPMLYYNAIILGVPLYIRDKAGYARLFNEALYQMEDFSLFGARMQLESARHLFKEVDHG